jgi:hypothetical protein
VFYGVFLAEQVDVVGDRGSEDTTAVDVQTLAEAFLNMSLRSTCFTNEHFSGNKDDFPQVLDYHKFQIVG